MAVFMSSKKGAPVQKGDLVGFKWNGNIKYPKDAIFVKVVSGVENDHIKVNGRSVFINDKYIGKAKEYSSDGKIKLDVIEPHKIEKDEIFVSTPHKDSLDSRYALVGTIKKTLYWGKLMKFSKTIITALCCGSATLISAKRLRNAWSCLQDSGTRCPRTDLR